MFSKATEYALRATIFIGRESENGKRPGLSTIARAISSPKPFTAKILQSLTRNNIISSSRGPNGGFYMNEKIKIKPVRLILKAMKDDEVLDRCILGLKQCSETKPCPMHSKYKLIKEELVKLFDTKTINDLIFEISDGKTYINNK